ncbi:hypothetical protein ACRALDRAFT_1063017 [Sodiomyces alcalophilus JCM 7366]|uniref:uncharacterized protein n=1 Tax=Sodiomyces alcalophilus JCM 7366 TaxID=591952 RepID=UPI0039B44BB3
MAESKALRRPSKLWIPSALCTISVLPPRTDNQTIKGNLTRCPYSKWDGDYALHTTTSAQRITNCTTCPNGLPFNQIG